MRMPSAACEVHERDPASNVGREAFLFLRWIVDNYDAPEEGFADVNVFCQASPSHYYYSGVAMAADVARLCAAADDAAAGWQPQWQRRINMLRSGLGFGAFGVWAWPWEFGSSRFQDKMDFFYESHFGAERPRRRTYVPGGCFFVSRARILSRSKAFYKRLMAPLSHEARPDFGFMVEKSWAEIFGAAAWCDARQHAPQHGERGVWGPNRWPCLVPTAGKLPGPSWLKSDFWHIIGHG